MYTYCMYVPRAYASGISGRARATFSNAVTAFQIRAQMAIFAQWERGKNRRDSGPGCTVGAALVGYQVAARNIRWLIIRL